ncbi:hypothetical protein Z517_09382 [Fonsecaea pedrosoi CBS 271.37]|uniref:Unplaced genomic scaffold supercont1.6, whole genome shotgun sequence n=1 Tax=Fonsecaea pedrosoi CBS 271.37 TaxID=1442368 RepID=A0A0D2G8D3_9EURO|nr:uncharacterized protein Z517_09382 [Fonsecaea pedrosoi CBS 271.37]KIW76938.1 hypothetical protein Z517_09382 [Fonsecaea pedrosoi CBS 271.37]
MAQPTSTPTTQSSTSWVDCYSETFARRALSSDPAVRGNIEHFLEHGYVVIPRCFSADEAGEARDEIAVGRLCQNGQKSCLGVYPLCSISTRPLLDLCSISSSLLDVILSARSHLLHSISSSLLDPLLLHPPLLDLPLLDLPLLNLYSTSTRPHPLWSISSSLLDPCLVDPLLPDPPLVCPPLVDPYVVDPPLLDPPLLDLVLSARSRPLCSVRRRTDHPFRIPYPECAEVACFDKTGTLTGEDLVVDGIAGLSLGKKSVQNEASGWCAVLSQQGPRLRHSYHTTLVFTAAHALIKTELEERDIVSDPMEKATTAHALIKLEEGDIVGDTMEKATLEARNWTFDLDDALISTPRGPGGRS